MVRLPAAVEPLLGSFRSAFFAPTYQRFVLLALGAILGAGRRSVSRILALLGDLAPGHSSSYHRVLSSACWSLRPLSKVLCQMILPYLPPEETVYLAVDDTIAEHRGRKVYGKGIHRDPVRSSWNYTALRHGHRWVVVSIVVRFPFAPRAWALPVMAMLSHTAKSASTFQVRHRTPCEVAQPMVLQLLRWFPQRRFEVLGDWGFGHHQFVHGLREPSKGRCHVTSRLRADARLYANASKLRRGRPQLRGQRLASPRDAAAKATLSTITVRWYGNQQRELRYLSDVGNWYWARGKGYGVVLPIRWVYVYDPNKDHSDCLFSTDLSLTPQQIIEHFSLRWSLEVTFQECRAHLALESPRQRTKKSVLRTTPCLLGLFSLVAICYARLVEAGQPPQPRRTPCYRKQHVTFSDALYHLRRELWQEIFMSHRLHDPMRQKEGPPLETALLDYLSAAA